MSWFDFARTAIKEAQKTIDKALDIKDEEGHTIPVQTQAVDPNNEDFFSSWGVETTTNTQEETSTVVTKSPTRSSAKINAVTSSLWGSFTGSFFEPNKPAEKSPSVENLVDDELTEDKFSRSKLVVRETSEDGEDCNEEEAKIQPQVKRRERPTSLHSNRLSAVSSDSGGRCSSDSVEVLGPGSTGCTTTPDSEITSSPTKHNSESVEVLPDSLTSPSSIEVLGSEATNSHRLSQLTDIELESPFESPVEKIPNNEEDIWKLSPDSVEVINEKDDEEEHSIDDSMSYLSISESTDATVLEPAKQEKELLHSSNKNSVNKLNMGESITSELSMSPDKLEPIITQAPGRNRSSHSLISTSFPNIIESNVIDIPTVNSSSDLQSESNDEGSQSDRTVMAESENMESSTEETVVDGATNSYYLKNMLADAMVEKTQLSDTENVREHSPISSESRSDLVKIGSEQTSGHTSGDELETATSSDIEIISSPNGGDSSSAQSCRHSVLRHGSISVRGHVREPSSASSEEGGRDVERLLRRVSELTDTLENKEVRLGEFERINQELLETNTELRSQLDGMLARQVDSVTEEWTQRLSALERKFQQAIRERDALRRQLEQVKRDASEKVSKSQLDATLAEREQLISELRTEGEKLSKQHLQHSNIIKKLRTKEKENETTIKNLKDQLEELTTETDRLKRSLTAKEEVERSQIDAVHQLTARNKKLETENNSVKSDLEDTQQKLATSITSLEAAKQELNELRRSVDEHRAKITSLQNQDEERQAESARHDEALAQRDELRQRIRVIEQDALKREQALRRENAELMKRIERTEAGGEDLARAVSEATRPLLRQLEAVQHTHTVKQSAWDNQEQELSKKLSDVQNKLSSLTEKERTSREECVTLRSSVASLEGKLSQIHHEFELITTKLEQERTEHTIAINDLNREKNNLLEQIKLNDRELESFRHEIMLLKDQLLLEKLRADQQMKSSSPKEQDVTNEGSIDSQHEGSVDTHNTSPTQSLRRLSFSESIASTTTWAQDEHTPTFSSNRFSNVFEIENLQSLVRQREAELVQFQRELQRRESERTFYSNELSSLTLRLDALQARADERDELSAKLDDLQCKYDALCLMYGEKVEENQELRLDLDDVKDMYKTQIDQLLQQQANNTQ